MDKRFQYVNVLIWDFDGTLYAPNKTLFKTIREAELKTIIHHTQWSRKKADKEFRAIHKITIPSAIATTAYLSNLSIKEALKEIETYFDRRMYLTRDEKLIHLFNHLKGYRHILFGNGVAENQKETLTLLGISPEIFELYVTPELVGVTKPDKAGFQYILNYIKLPPDECLMIGDREKVEIIPAKELGMRTCLVWSEEKSIVADVTLSSVYDIERILL